MKKILFVWAMALLVISCNSEGDQGGNGSGLTGSSELTNSVDSMSYAVGNYFTSQFQQQGIKIQPNEVARGLSEGLKGETYMDEDGLRTFILAYQAEMAGRQGRPVTDEDPLKVAVDTLSYATGADFAMQMKSFGMEINAATFLQGASDVLKEGAGLFTEAQVQNQLKSFSMEIQNKQMEKNAELGRQFIAEKAKEEGVKSTPSGLHYKVLKEGNGPNPKATDKVKVHYHGTLIDGTVFDSSVDRGEPIEFSLSGVIRGWTEGLQLMKPNAKFQFYIPANLAYENRGSGPLIGPGATLIFDVELLEIK